MEHLIIDTEINNIFPTDSSPPISISNFEAIHGKLNTYSDAKKQRSHVINCKEFDNVYIISDIHADFRKFLQTLQLNNLISLTLDPYNGDDIYNPQIITNATWTGGEKTIVLILGDLIDGKRDPQAYSEVDDNKGCFEILLHIFLHNMKILANNSKSELIFTLGNHDLAGIYGVNPETRGRHANEFSSYFNKFVHSTAKSYYNNTPLNRANFLLPFYNKSCYLLITFVTKSIFSSTEKEEIICLHAGIPTDTDGKIIDRNVNYQDSISRFKDLQTQIDLNGVDPNNYNQLFDINSISPNNSNISLLYTREISEKNKEVCEKSKPEDPLVIIGHCPTNSLNANFQTILGLPSEQADHVNHGCDYYPRDSTESYFKNINDFRGCIMLGCAHHTKNYDDPRYVLVDTASSQAFRYNNKQYETYTGSKYDINEFNKNRKVEIFKLFRATRILNADLRRQKIHTHSG